MLQNNSNACKRVIRAFMWISFSAYCALLLFLLFSNMRYRSSLPLGEYFRNHTNFIPFKTISTFIVRFFNQTINTRTVVKNLLGNLVAFLPMGFFLPCLFRRLRRARSFTLVLLALLAAIEVAQLLSRVGSLDIDDLILNYAGALLMFAVCRAKRVSRLLQRLYLMSESREKTKNGHDE